MTNESEQRERELIEASVARVVEGMQGMQRTIRALGHSIAGAKVTAGTAGLYKTMKALDDASKVFGDEAAPMLAKLETELAALRDGQERRREAGKSDV